MTAPTSDTSPQKCTCPGTGEKSPFCPVHNNLRVDTSPGDELRTELEDAIDNHRFDSDFPSGLNFKAIQYVAETLEPVVNRLMLTARIEGRLDAYRQVEDDWDKPAFKEIVTDLHEHFLKKRAAIDAQLEEN